MYAFLRPDRLEVTSVATTPEISAIPNSTRSARDPIHRFLLVAVDLAVAAMIAATQWAPVMIQRPFDAITTAGLGLMGVMIVGVVLRWRHPLAATTVITAATLLGLVIGVTTDPMLGVAWAIYPLALQKGFRQGSLRLGLFLLVLLLAAAFASAPWNESVLIALTAIAVVTCSWTLGSAVGDRAIAAAEAAQERAHVVAVQQRLDVAREVHDVVAHTLGTIGVEAAVAAHIDTLTNAELREQLAEISTTSRQALGQVRGLLTTLRSDETGRTEAAPTLADLDRVFDRARAAGISVTTAITGTDRLGAVEQLAVYRIVQEAVTNVVRHAPRSTCHIAISQAGRWLVIDVTNNGEARVPTLIEGNGLKGIHERAQAAGGSCVIATTTTRGVHVHVELPYFDSSSPLVEEGRIGE